MNRLGMLVDLSHVNNYTMLDALDTSVAPGQSYSPIPILIDILDIYPCLYRYIQQCWQTLHAVIFSHSSSYALCPKSRNVPDNVLAKLVSTPDTTLHCLDTVQQFLAYIVYIFT